MEIIKKSRKVWESLKVLSEFQRVTDSLGELQTFSESMGGY